MREISDHYNWGIKQIKNGFHPVKLIHVKIKRYRLLKTANMGLKSSTAILNQNTNMPYEV